MSILSGLVSSIIVVLGSIDLGRAMSVWLALADISSGIEELFAVF
jgi:hypothetical protein